MHLASLTDQEIVSYFRTTRNDFTTTTLEAELAERLAAALDGKDDELEELEELRKEIRYLNDELSGAGKDERDEIDELKRKLASIEDIITNR